MDAKIEHHDFCIGILPYVIVRLFQQVSYFHHIAFVYKGSETRRELRFLGIHVVQIGTRKIINEIFPYHTLGIRQEMAQPFASESGNLFAPLFEVFDTSGIGQPHNLHK